MNRIFPEHDQDRRPLIMGILNVTPDSFSDGGLHVDVDKAVAHALSMVEAGAAIVDVGGESTRPGARAVSASEQCARVLPVIERLRETLPAVRISIDTRLPDVAARALDAGARMVNDISAGGTPGMFEVLAERDVPVVLMHMQGTPDTMQNEPHYDDVVTEIRDYLVERAEQARALGIAADNIILDPGVGFGKNRQHNLAIMANLGVFVATGYAVLLGASRKRFMGSICREEVFSELVGATCATTVLGVQAGIRIFRVHDVKPNRQALDVAWAIEKQHARTQHGSRL
jgi:dihydropteroate synthase